MIGLALPMVRVFHDPDGGNAATNNERIHYLYLYEGVEPSGGPTEEVERGIYKWTA